MNRIDQYLIIPSFARTNLDLKGNELLVFSLIYGFGQDGISRFRGSLDYICDWTGASKPSVISALSKLQDKGFIEKFDVEVNGACKKTEYAICLSGLKNFTRELKNLNRTGKETLLAIQYDNIESDNIVKENNIINNITKESSKISRFAKPTIEEITSYCEERKNGIDAETFYDFYESKGWKVGKTTMKDWKASVRTWERARKAYNKPIKEQKVNSSIQTYNYSKKKI